MLDSCKIKGVLVGFLPKKENRRLDIRLFNNQLIGLLIKGQQNTIIFDLGTCSMFGQTLTNNFSLRKRIWAQSLDETCELISTRTNVQ